MVKRYSGLWLDIGTWDALSSIIGSEHIGNIIAKDVENSTIINQTDMPLLCLGISDLIVAASNNGMIVLPKNSIYDIKSLIKNSKKKIL